MPFGLRPILTLPSPFIPVAANTLPFQTIEVPYPPVKGPVCACHETPSTLVAIVFVFVVSLPTRTHIVPFHTRPAYPDGFWKLGPTEPDQFIASVLLEIVNPVNGE